MPLQQKGAGNIFPALIYFLIIASVTTDLLTTYLSTPDLKYESNVIVKVFHFGWRELLLFNLYIVILFLLLFYYANRLIKKRNTYVPNTKMKITMLAIAAFRAFLDLGWENNLALNVYYSNFFYLLLLLVFIFHNTWFNKNSHARNFIFYVIPMIGIFIAFYKIMSAVIASLNNYFHFIYINKQDALCYHFTKQYVELKSYFLFDFAISILIPGLLAYFLSIRYILKRSSTRINNL